MHPKHLKALFAGSFDPFHLGHLDLLKRALEKYQDVIVSVAINPNKQSKPLQERYLQVRKFLDAHGYKDVQVVLNEGLTVTQAQDLDCSVLIRGYRNQKDFLYEQALSFQNRLLNPNIKTDLFFANPNYLNVSSSMLKDTKKSSF